MRKVFVIGIGAGNPDYITVQAINALNEVNVFFVMDKGPEKEDLVRLRKEICERYTKDKSYRTIQIRDPERDRTSSSYESAVKAWHDQRATLYEGLIGQELGEGECGGLPGLGRSVALRQYVTDYRSDHCPRDHCIRIRSDSWNKQHSGSGRTTQDHSEPDRTVRSYYDRAQDIGGTARQYR